MEIKNNKKGNRKNLFENVVDKMFMGVDKASQVIDNAINVVTEAFKDTSFCDVKMDILQYLEKKKNLKSAVVNLQIVENMGLYDVSWRTIFSQVSKSEGKVLETSTITTKGISKEHMPNYIIDNICTNGSIEIKLNESDLAILYKEKEEEVIKETEYSDIIESCKENSVSRIIFYDRVFYTYAEFYDNDTHLVDSKCFEKIANLPEQILVQLYPCSQCEFNL